MGKHSKGKQGKKHMLWIWAAGGALDEQVNKGLHCCECVVYAGLSGLIFVFTSVVQVEWVKAHMQAEVGGGSGLVEGGDPTGEKIS